MSESNTAPAAEPALPANESSPVAQSEILISDSFEMLTAAGSSSSPEATDSMEGAKLKLADVMPELARDQGAYLTIEPCGGDTVISLGGAGFEPPMHIATVRGVTELSLEQLLQGSQAFL